MTCVYSEAYCLLQNNSSRYLNKLACISTVASCYAPSKMQQKSEYICNEHYKHNCRKCAKMSEIRSLFGGGHHHYGAI